MRTLIMTAPLTFTLLAGCKAKEGEPCEATEACKEGLTCLDAQCFRPRTAGEACTEARECSEGLVCLDEACFALRSPGDACEDRRQCQEGLTCHAEACAPAVAEGGACEASTQCGEGLVCHPDSCVPQLAIGASCEADAQCGDEAACFAMACLASAELSAAKTALTGVLERYRESVEPCERGAALKPRFEKAIVSLDFAAADAVTAKIDAHWAVAEEITKELHADNAAFRRIFDAAHLGTLGEPMVDIEGKVPFCNQHLQRAVQTGLETATAN